MSKIKIAFIGSHGTGKSSAASHLGAVLKQNNPAKSIKIIEENVREVSRLVGGKINTPEFQKLCMVQHLTQEFSAEQLYDVVICDRSAVDTLIYGLVYNLKLPSEYFSLAINHLNTFHKIYFVRPDSPGAYIANDNFRDTNIEIRAEVDKEFERLLKLWGGNYTELKTHEIFKFDYIKDIYEDKA